jgi:hypothetical protein
MIWGWVGKLWEFLVYKHMGSWGVPLSHGSNPKSSSHSTMQCRDHRRGLQLNHCTVHRQISKVFKRLSCSRRWFTPKNIEHTWTYINIINIYIYISYIWGKLPEIEWPVDDSFEICWDHEVFSACLRRVPMERVVGWPRKRSWQMAGDFLGCCKLVYKAH